MRTLVPKRDCLSLLTRDISIIAALLDLIDNSVNAAVEPFSESLRSAEEYLQIFQDQDIKPTISVRLSIAPDKVEIVDTANGISAATAAAHVFKFGRGKEEGHEKDRLSVYGIGLKRAMFKLGDQIHMHSDHVEGGLDLILNVSEWAADATLPWTFKISPRPPAKANK